MKKNLLLCGFAVVATLFGSATINAATRSWFFDELGEVMGVSDNGKYVAISDIDNLRGYVWNIDSPDALTDLTITTTETGLPSSQVITGVSVMDFADNGMGVGSVYYKDGKQKAAYYEDGEWKYLPLHEFAMNLTEAIAVTPDGMTIAGYQFVKDEASEIAGRYYPCQWFRNEDGSYEMQCYTDLELPAQQGFYPLTQNPDGTIIGGMLYCGAGSTIPVLLNNGELQYFSHLETILEPFYYKDQLLGYFDEYYIDGYKDGAVGDYFEGGFDNCDANGNFYGMRTRAENVTEDGRGDLVRGACIYNVNTGEWIDNPSISLYTAGLGTDILFNGNGGVTMNGETKKVKDAFDLETTRSIAGVSKTSCAGRVLGGMWQEINPATGEYTYYPFVVELDEQLVSGVETVVDADRNIIILSPGRIDIANGTEAAVYTLDGRLAGIGSTVELAAGVYVVKIGETSSKVLVR